MSDKLKQALVVYKADIRESQNSQLGAAKALLAGATLAKAVGAYLAEAPAGTLASEEEPAEPELPTIEEAASLVNEVLSSINTFRHALWHDIEAPKLVRVEALLRTLAEEKVEMFKQYEDMRAAQADLDG